MFSLACSFLRVIPLCMIVDICAFMKLCLTHWEIVCWGARAILGENRENGCAKRYSGAIVLGLMCGFIN